jgi:hypothetical protein
MMMFKRINSFLLTAAVVAQVYFTCSRVEGFQAHTERRMAQPAFVLKHETTKTVESSRRKVELPPVIQQIADERAEFQINLGRAMDTLRRDMPEILSRTPGT